MRHLEYYDWDKLTPEAIDKAKDLINRNSSDMLEGLLDLYHEYELADHPHCCPSIHIYNHFKNAIDNEYI